MNVSEARRIANRLNAQKSSGPKSEAGKARSRANGLKHGLTGQGIVIPEEEISELESLTQTLQAEFDPKTAVGELLVRQLALHSIRMDRGAEHESAAIAQKVRHAIETFDDERFEEAEQLLDTIGEAPRIHLRKLRKSSEGVDRLILEWTELRENVSRQNRPVWTAWHLERAVNLTGSRIEAAQGSLFNALSKALWGDFRAIENLETNDLEGDARKAAARAQLVERIDFEIAALRAHRETLDLETIDLDRAEAGSRALFDPSPEANLARRYEAAAQRNFFRALNELRRVEAECADSLREQPAPEMASCCAAGSATRESMPRAPQPSPELPIYQTPGPIQGTNGQVVRVIRVPKPSA